MNPYTRTLWAVGGFAAAATLILAVVVAQESSVSTAGVVAASWMNVTGWIALLTLLAAFVVSALRWQPEAQAEPTTTAAQPAPHTDADGL